jgi:hypothetical protein
MKIRWRHPLLALAVLIAACGNDAKAHPEDADSEDVPVEDTSAETTTDLAQDDVLDAVIDTSTVDTAIDFPCEPAMDAGDECESLVGVCASTGVDCFWDPSTCTGPGCSCVFSDVDDATCAQKCYVCACEQLCGPAETCVGITDGAGHPVMIGEHWLGICSWL